MIAQLIDTHAHLQLNHFDADRDEAIQRAYEAGLAAIICISTDVASSRAAIALAEKHQHVYAAVGIHPNDCAATSDDEVKQIAELAQHPKVVAIGETGMDDYWKAVPLSKQAELFARQLELAAQRNKPVIIHNREAGAAIMDTLRAHGVTKLSGVFHCFTEDWNYAEQVLNLGCHVSFTGNLTYKKSALPEVAKQIPLERIMLETDSPYMTPVPHRGKRNEPAYTVHIAEKLAEVKGLLFAEVCARTTENAVALFGLDI
ncbi:TatD family hydrolase [candidate division KSB1 bacterium]|nr:TatD family hydrolase [candidate division KSB1 bacterium]